MEQRKLKVAQIITRMDWGGSPDIVRLLCENLDRDRFNIKFITGASDNPTQKTKIFFENLEDNLIFIKQLKRNISPIDDFIAFIKLVSIFKREKFDIVHTHTAKAGALGRLAAKFCGVKKIIHTSHGLNFYGYFGRLLSQIVVWVEKFLALFTDKFIVLTKLEKNDLQNYRITDGSKIIMVNTAVEADKFIKAHKNEIIVRRRKFGISDEKLIVGMVGRLEPIKGPEYFVDMANLACKKYNNLQFICAGEGSLRLSLQEKIEQLKIKDKFIFTGWHNNVLEIISLLDILVLASLNEAVGLVLIEAQAQGVPVIATRVGGIPEIVEDGKSGILVKPQDAQSLFNALEELIKDPVKRTNMGNFAAQSVANKYKPAELTQRVTDIYLE
ncbi:MAG: glycosyltransferase family 4 protein [Candidatus Omnitrophota bacterium]